MAVRKSASPEVRLENMRAHLKVILLKLINRRFQQVSDLIE